MTKPAPESSTSATLPDRGPAAWGCVVVAEDDVLLREGIAARLQRRGFQVVDQASDAAALLSLVREHTPDLALIDTRMPPTHRTEGLVAAYAIRSKSADIGIVLLSTYVEVEHAMDLPASGQRIGYLFTSRVMQVNEFLHTLDRMTRCGSVVDPRTLWVTEGTADKHVHHILTKLRLPDSGDGHRRVLAVITFLDAR